MVKIMGKIKVKIRVKITVRITVIIMDKITIKITVKITIKIAAKITVKITAKMTGKGHGKNINFCFNSNIQYFFMHPTIKIFKLTTKKLNSSATFTPNTKVKLLSIKTKKNAVVKCFNL